MPALSFFDMFAELWPLLASASQAELQEACMELEGWGDSLQPRDITSRFRANGTLPPDKQLIDALEIAQAIDNWAYPIYDWVKIPPDDAHMMARQQLRKTGALNTLLVHGAVIPRRCEWTRGGRAMTTQGVAGLFDNLQLMPPAILANDVDDLPPRSRAVRVAYRTFPRTPLKPPSAPLRVAVAPHLHAEPDALEDLSERDGKHFYNILPRAPLDRAEDALCEAIIQGAWFVLFPEMVFDADALPALQACVRRVIRGSQICFVLAGLSKQRSVGGFGANEIVLFDHMGRLVARQSKLFRWNLRDDQRRRFGIGMHLDAGKRLFENIPQTETMLLLDVPALGRVTLLICADLSAQEPKDWIHANLFMDWSLVALMDGEIDACKWMYRDAVALAANSGGRVVVGNSLWLTALNNRALVAAPSTGHAPVTESGVGLFVDGMNNSLLLQRATLAPAPLAVYADWHESGWTPHTPL